MTRMTLALYARRKMMLELYYAGAFNKTTFKKLAAQENVSEAALRKDWSRRKQWEPLIWKAEQSEDDSERLLYVLQIARERAISLMRSAGPDYVKVMAVGKVADIVRREIELRQSLGKIRKEPDKLDIKGQLEVPQLEGLNEEAITAVIKNFMESEADKLRPKDTESIPSSEGSN